MRVSTGSVAEPPSVQYTLAVLGIQAGIWTLIAVFGFLALAVNAREILWGQGLPPHGVRAFAVDVLLLYGAAGMASVTWLVVAELLRRRAGARLAAIALECLLACYGVYCVFESGSVAGVIGGGGGAILSCGAIGCLLGRPARRFTRPEALSI